MKTIAKAFFVILFSALFFLSVVYGANTRSTTMTWVVVAGTDHSVAYGGSCTPSAFYFVESDAVHDSDADGNATQVVPNSSSEGGSGTYCQDGSTKEGMTITNNGNIDINIDGNFTVAFSGADLNIVLKVWKGNDTHCGTNGMGGWQDPCSVTAAGNPVTTTTCRKYDVDNETTVANLIGGLQAGDTNALCFSGDFNNPVGFVSGIAQGSYAHVFDTNSKRAT